MKRELIGAEVNIDGKEGEITNVLGNGYEIVFFDINDVANWKTKDNYYTADCIDIINSYYGSVKEFENAYKNGAYREQILAEMIFESTTYTDTDAYEVVPGDEVENTLRKYRKESLLS